MTTPREARVSQFWLSKASAAVFVTCAMLMPAIAARSDYNGSRTPRCDASVYQRGENVPASTSDRAHEIIHASSIQEHGKVVGWIYQDRNGSLDFQAATDPSVLA